MTYKLEITDSGGTNQKVLLNGEDISGGVRGITYKASPSQLPSVTLDLLVTVVAELQGENVKLREQDIETLKALGWTPPEEAS